MTRVAIPKTVQIYTDEAGYQPFAEWLDDLKDAGDRHRIIMRLRRIESGNLGDCKHISDGVCELRLFFGAGYMKTKDWWYIGLVTSIVYLLIWVFIGGAWWKLLNLW